MHARLVETLPEGDDWSEPGPEVVAPQSDQSATQASRDVASNEATKKLRGKADQLQRELEDLFISQNTSSTQGYTTIPATFLRVTVLKN